MPVVKGNGWKYYPNALTFAVMIKRLMLSDDAAAIFSANEKRLYFVLLFFFIALYMPGVDWLYNVAMWLVFVVGFSVNTPAEKWALLKKRRGMLLLILFFLLNVGSGLLSDNVKSGVAWIGIRISFIVFPLSIGSVLIGKLLKERLLFGFVVATLCAAVLCICYASVRAISLQDAQWLYNDNLSEIINLQSIYFAMLVNLTLCCFGWLYTQRSVLIGKYSWIPVLLILLPVHFLLASRVAIITLYSIVFLFAVYNIIARKKIRQGILLVGALLATAGVLLFIFPKTINRFKELGYTKFDYSSMGKESHYNMELTSDQWNGANLRIAVWECAWTVAREHMIFGTGLGDKVDVLKQQYAKKGFTFGISTNRNVHNTYLDVWMSMGLVGLLIFVAGCFVFPGIACVKTADWLGGLMIACFCISVISETYIDRTIGNTILSFFLSFMACYKKPPAADGY